MNLWGVLPHWLSLFLGSKDVSYKGHNKVVDEVEGALLEKIVAVVKKSGLSTSESVGVNRVEVELEVDAELQAFSILEKQAEDSQESCAPSTLRLGDTMPSSSDTSAWRFGLLQ